MDDPFDQLARLMIHAGAHLAWETMLIHCGWVSHRVGGCSFWEVWSQTGSIGASARLDDALLRQVRDPVRLIADTAERHLFRRVEAEVAEAYYRMLESEQ